MPVAVGMTNQVPFSIKWRSHHLYVKSTKSSLKY